MAIIWVPAEEAESGTEASAAIAAAAAATGSVDDGALDWAGIYLLGRSQAAIVQRVLRHQAFRSHGVMECANRFSTQHLRPWKKEYYPNLAE